MSADGFPSKAFTEWTAAMTPKVAYLAGPMRSKPLFNFPAFDAAAADLRTRGYVVISPAELDREAGFEPSNLPADFDWNGVPVGFDLSAAIRRDFEAIMRADLLIMLPGWQRSKGATAEAAIAGWRGIPVEEYQPEDVLEEAIRITRGDRQAQYGPPDQDFRRTAGMWTAMFEHLMLPGSKFEPFHVAQAMIALKLSRLQHATKRDSVVDVAGYARCLDTCYRSNGGYDHR